MLDRTLVECNRPVGIVFADRRIDAKSPWQLYIDLNFLSMRFKLRGKFTLLLGVCDNIIIQMPTCRNSIDAQSTLFKVRFCKDIRGENLGQFIIG